MKPKVITSGVDSEYVLADLSEYLRSRGFEVIELDFGKVKGCVRSLLTDLSSCETVYLTSAHTILTLRTARMVAPVFAKLYPHYLAPIEIIPLLQPRASIFVPHDLLSPFGDSNLNELKFLDLYDHVLAPVVTDQLLRAAGTETQVHQAGWIKYRVQETMTPQIEFAPSAIRVSLFLTIIQHMQFKYGIEGFVDYLRPILTPEINVKLPAWKGIEALENRIREVTGANIIPASVSSIELMEQSDLVMCNSVSSILAEASLMGKPCICLLDREGGEPDDKRLKMADFPDLIWHPYEERKPISIDVIQTATTKPLQRRIEPFDFRFVESLIARS
ncbi:hypothetical protein VN12_04580 [Pirellula sp. SH-Sr6A]|uniref:hypothetical protein n=1 Tax=Pirellula sp. SH-Sr6A TaxID=1632865 RepID=UPI00078D6AA7|nr:hypothetical protein [Pirellula sp. SH-Sr6A]AMV31370.1 hypothetical protein VN12_04580 [Pirellula sp. SH-Sr6A]